MENRKRKCLFVLMLPFAFWFVAFYNFDQFKYFHQRCVNCRNNCANNDRQVAYEILAGNYTFKLNQTTNVYEVDGKPVIWLYWNNETLPDFAKLLVEAILCTNPEFKIILINSNSVNSYWPEYPKFIFDKLIPAHQADLVRVHVLKTFGGVYLDVDTFPVSSLSRFYDLLTDYDLVGSDWKPLGTELSVGHLGPTRANTSLLQLWAMWQDLVIEQKTPIIETSESYPLKWAELLADISMPIIRYLNHHNVIRYIPLDGVHTVGQLVRDNFANDVMEPLRTSSYDKLKQLNRTPILYFHNSAQPKKLMYFSTYQLLSSTEETIFGFLTKCALKKCYSNYTSSADKKVETNLTALNVQFLIQILEKQNSSLYPCVF